MRFFAPSMLARSSFGHAKSPLCISGNFSNSPAVGVRSVGLRTGARLASQRALFSTSRSAAQQAAPAPKRRRSLFKQLLRLTGVSILAGVGYIGYQLYTEIALPDQIPIDVTKPKLVVVGSGWGAVALLKTIDTSKYNVTVISARNYFLFTPLLPSTATGMVEHRSIMEATRAILRQRKGASTFIEGEVVSVDPYAKTVKVDVQSNSHKELEPGLPHSETDVPYDKLVLAVGSTTNYFGMDSVKDNAYFLKEIEDTQRIRRRIMDCMEAASLPDLPRETRRRLMHAVVVGAGATGVEFAGELHDFVYKDMRKFNPEIVKDFKVSLIEATGQVLSTFNKQLVDYALDTLEREQINVMTDTVVTGADKENVFATKKNADGSKSDISVPYGLFVWAGGIGVRDVVRDLFKRIPEQNSSRRGLKVDEFLRVKGVQDMWAIGDCSDAGLAPTAQVASQEGVYVGQMLDRMAQITELEEQLALLPAQAVNNTGVAVGDVKDPAASERHHVERHLRRLRELPQFKYSHQGSLAYIGSDKAVADLEINGHNFASGGTVTYIFWRSVYLSMVVSMRNKLLVAMDWTKVMLFGRDISRE